MKDDDLDSDRYLKAILSLFGEADDLLMEGCLMNP
jgi:hypothetical protein